MSLDLDLLDKQSTIDGTKLHHMVLWYFVMECGERFTSNTDINMHILSKKHVINIGRNSDANASYLIKKPYGKLQYIYII